MITEDSLRAAQISGGPATSSRTGGTASPAEFPGGRVHRPIHRRSWHYRLHWASSPAMIGVISTSATILALAAFAIASFGSLRTAFGYYFRGEVLFADATERSFGIVGPGERVPVSFRLTNRGAQRIRILGCRAQCSCATSNELPITLGPHEATDFYMTVYTRAIDPTQMKRVDLLDIPVTLYTSIPGQSRFGLVIRGEVRAKPGATE